MKKVLQVVAMMCVALIFCNSITQTTVSATSALMSGGTFVSITTTGQVVDSITSNGIKVNAIFRPYTGTNGTDSTYSCAAFVSKYYSKIFGVTVSNLWSISSTPQVSNGSFSSTTNPKEGDIIRDNVSVHWAIVKSVSSNGTVTVIQQNAWDETRTKAWIGAKIYSGNQRYTFFRYSGNKLGVYNIAYNANGGTGTIATSKVVYGSDFTIAKSGFTRTGYTLAGYNVYRSSDKTWYTSGGWATASEITSNGYAKRKYILGATHTFDNSWAKGASAGDTYTFYAIWNPNSYNITYSANGGTGTMASSTVNTNGNMIVSECSFIREGYYFAGYNVNRKSDNTWYVSGQGWLTYPQIKSNGYTKRPYNPGDIHIFNTSWTNGSVAGDTYTFYPIWKPTNPTLLFYENYSGANYMSEGILDSEVFEENYYTRDANVYTVTLDNTQKLNNQGSIKIVATATGSMNSDVAFTTDTNQGKEMFDYASDAKAMTLSFWAKGTVDGAKMYLRWGHTEDKTEIILKTEWEKYTIDMTKQHYDGEAIHVYLDTAGVFYINNLCLRDSGSEFYRQETSGLYDTIAYEYGATYDFLPTPVRDGYTFLGWYTAKSGGTQITSDTDVFAENTKVYAHWEKEFSDIPIESIITTDGKRYELYNNALSWEEAKAHCEKLGGHLVTINSADENDLVYRMIENQAQILWIGAYFDKILSNWCWVTDEQFDYTNWASNEPSNSVDSPEYYAHMYPFDVGLANMRGKWNDALGINSWTSHYGRQNASYICEYEDTFDEPVEDVNIYFFDKEHWEDIYISYYNEEEDCTIFDFMTYEGYSEYGRGYSVKIPSNVTEFYFGSTIEEDAKRTVTINAKIKNNMAFIPKIQNAYGLFEVNTIEYYDGGFYFPSFIIKGDANNDGTVSLMDIIEIHKYLVGLTTFNDYQIIAADANRDDNISIKDAKTIQKYLVGIISSLE